MSIALLLIALLLGLAWRLMHGLRQLLRGLPRHNEDFVLF